jgi:hypothetical protein
MKNNNHESMHQVPTISDVFFLFLKKKQLDY